MAALAPPRAAAGAAMAWAPAVGLLLGVIASAVLFLADHPLGAGPLTASGLAVGSLALLTRGLHLDGLADLADGLASGKPAPAALDIMRRSDIGPLGVVTLVLTLLLQVAALSQAESAGHGRGPAALIAAVVTGRLGTDLGLPPGRARGAAGRARRPGRRIGPPGGPGYGYRGHAGGRGRGGRDLGDGGRRSSSAGPSRSRWPRAWPRRSPCSGTPSGGSAASPVTCWARWPRSRPP